MNQKVKIVQDENYSVFFEKERIGGITKYFKDWSSFAEDSVGNIYGLEISHSKEDAVDKLLEWHGLK